MCGISGILAFETQNVERMESLIQRMNSAISHRGPDGSGQYVRENVALGHRRLSILDLSEAGAQPMKNEDDSLVLVFNGEIYNYIELTKELENRGHVFKSHTDSEVILHAYEEWGADCVHRFNGMWSFAIWNEREQTLFASRDRLGVKPFFYLQHNSVLFFSSEISGLRAVVPVREANLGKIHDFLAYGYRTNNGETFFKGIHELLPGHNLICRDGDLQMKRYWALPTEPTKVPASEWVDAYAELLRDSVRLRFRSDVPVALLQSGGIDSSVICSIVNDEIASGRLGTDSVSAFTATYPGHAYDESLPVRELMNSCPNIRSIEITPQGDGLASEYRDYMRAMQEPMGSAASYAHWSLMRELRKQNIKVVLNGQGADEALAGYGRYVRGYRMLDLLLSQPGSVISEARAMRENMSLGYGNLIAQTVKAMLGRRRASQFRAQFIEKSFSVLRGDFKRNNRDYLPDLSMVWTGGNLDRHLRGQIHDYGFNQIMHYEDQSSMSHGIEIRSPFVDYRLMEFAFGLPDDEKFSGGVTKRILRQGFAKRVPSSIINAKLKLGFATPFSEWMKSPALLKFVKSILDTDRFKSCAIWDGKALASKMLAPGSLQAEFPVWRYLMVAVWLEEYDITNAY